jgi:hypothetical protein
LEDDYAGRLPWIVASVKLNCGPVVFAHAQPELTSGDSVRVCNVEDKGGNVMLVALAIESTAQSAALQWLTEIQFTEIRA